MDGPPIFCPGGEKVLGPCLRKYHWNLTGNHAILILMIREIAFGGGRRRRARGISRRGRT